MRVIIAGSRSFNAPEVLPQVLRFSGWHVDELVSGGARGVDRLAEEYAKKMKWPIKQFIPNWDIGKHAGKLRNIEMAEYADALIAIWDGMSPGTAHMIATMTSFRKPTFVYMYGEK